MHIIIDIQYDRFFPAHFSHTNKDFSNCLIVSRLWVKPLNIMMRLTFQYGLRLLEFIYLRVGKNDLHLFAFLKFRFYILFHSKFCIEA